MQDYVSEITWLFGPVDWVFSQLNTEIEGRFGVLEPIRWPFQYSLDDSVVGFRYSLADLVAVFGILGPIRFSYAPLVTKLPT